MQLHGSSWQGQIGVCTNPFVLLSPRRGSFSPASPRQRGWGDPVFAQRSPVVGWGERASARPGGDSLEHLKHR